MHFLIPSELWQGGEKFDAYVDRYIYELIFESTEKYYTEIIDALNEITVSGSPLEEKIAKLDAADTIKYLSLTETERYQADAYKRIEETMAGYTPVDNDLTGVFIDETNQICLEISAYMINPDAGITPENTKYFLSYKSGEFSFELIPSSWSDFEYESHRVMFYFEENFPNMSESSLRLELNSDGEYHYFSYIQNTEVGLDQLVDGGLLTRTETTLMAR